MINSCSECEVSPLLRAPHIAGPSARVHGVISCVCCWWNNLKEMFLDCTAPEVLSCELMLWRNIPRMMARASPWVKHQNDPLISKYLLWNKFSWVGEEMRLCNTCWAICWRPTLEDLTEVFGAALKVNPAAGSLSSVVTDCVSSSKAAVLTCRIWQEGVSEFLKDTRNLAATLAGLHAVIILTAQTAETRAWKLFIQD